MQSKYPPIRFAEVLILGDAQIEDKVLGMDARERARIALKLIDSLDDLTESEWLDLWVDEACRRDAEMDAGNEAGIPSEVVFNELNEHFN